MSQPAPARPAPAKKAAAEVLGGEPKDSARAWLGPLTVAVAILFALDTYLVATQPLQAYDIPITTWVQNMSWGPVTYVFELTNNTAATSRARRR